MLPIFASEPQREDIDDDVDAYNDNINGNDDDDNDDDGIGSKVNSHKSIGSTAVPVAPL